ncbi:MAG: Crp/Fnr family transcriptional regulator [Leptolyngbya sp. SIO4C5]|nr:Crp/Fnr family transcriptional regulator [Leptolyngbya sp. SIO4C5]
MSHNRPQRPIALENRLLASLPTAEYQRLHPHLEHVRLSLGQVLYESGQPIEHVYFPLNSLVSLVSSGLEPAATEFNLVGNEGLVGMSALLGGGSTINRAVVQVADGAMKIDAQTLKAEFERGEILNKQALLYLQLSFTQTAQNVVCRIHHLVEPRLARWLLSIQDRLQCNEMPMTQKYIALLLGTRRATINTAAGHLQQLGLIRYSRGQITIVDRPALEQSACKCYALLQAEQVRLQAISRTIYEA